jgi:diguanylate cyclase (GGDEF)-like protein
MQERDASGAPVHANRLRRGMARFCATLGLGTFEQLGELVSAQHHGPAIARHRAALIQRRVFGFAALFALLVPAWALVDLLVLPRGLWNELLATRAVSALALLALARLARGAPELRRARVLLGALLAITPLFYLASAHWIHGYALQGLALADAQLYAQLPFVIVAGLALFPLTALEFHAYALPLLGVALAGMSFHPAAALPHAIATLWLLVLLLGVALLSALGQLRYMLAQVMRASYDTLTGALTRRAGIDVLDLQFRLAAINASALSLLFFDLDHFKSVNDTFGHDVGDRVLRDAAHALSKAVRKGDSVIRWGGEEFVVVLPTADAEEADAVVDRIIAGGLGRRPDGAPVTASIGVAEARADAPQDWRSQVEIADRRMYAAKAGGRARSVGVRGQARLWRLAPVAEA